jgi:hypothetical protein
MHRPRFRDASHHQQIEEFRKEQEQSVIREFEDEAKEDQINVELYPDSAIIRIGDGLPSEEWQRKNKDLMDAKLCRSYDPLPTRKTYQYQLTSCKGQPAVGVIITSKGVPPY